MHACAQDVTIVRAFVLAQVRSFGLDTDHVTAWHRQQQREGRPCDSLGPSPTPPPTAAGAAAMGGVLSGAGGRVSASGVTADPRSNDRGAGAAAGQGPGPKVVAGPIPALSSFLFDHAVPFWHELRR